MSLKYCSSARQAAVRDVVGGAHPAPLGGEDRDVEIQVLRGLGDDLQEALAKRGDYPT